MPNHEPFELIIREEWNSLRLMHIPVYLPACACGWRGHEIIYPIEYARESAMNIAGWHETNSIFGERAAAKLAFGYYQ